MRNIAIIGSGIVGLVAAHGLLKAGYHVTLYSDHVSQATGRPWQFSAVTGRGKVIGN